VIVGVHSACEKFISWHCCQQFVAPGSKKTIGVKPGTFYSLAK